MHSNTQENWHTRTSERDGDGRISQSSAPNKHHFNMALTTKSTIRDRMCVCVCDARRATVHVLFYTAVAGRIMYFFCFVLNFNLPATFANSQRDQETKTTTNCRRTQRVHTVTSKWWSVCWCVVVFERSPRPHTWTPHRMHTTHMHLICRQSRIALPFWALREIVVYRTSTDVVVWVWVSFARHNTHMNNGYVGRYFSAILGVCVVRLFFGECKNELLLDCIFCTTFCIYDDVELRSLRVCARM